MDSKNPIENRPPMENRRESRGRHFSTAAWLPALLAAAVALYLGWKLLAPAGLAQSEAILPPSIQSGSSKLAALPDLRPTEPVSSIVRRSELRTIIPSRPREDVLTYTVGLGDSVFEIAEKFRLKPESVLWGNYSLLNDNPDLISVGMKLRIPPTDGVLYEWQPGDSLEAIAGQFKASVEALVNWPGNRLDLIDPQIPAGMLVMVPGGQREFRQWLIPTIPRGSAGVASSVYGDGACEGGYEGAYGTGTFVWPAANHALSGNDYWPGHLAIDIAAGDGAAIFAADSGVVVFTGWANGGYGYTVMIDHGNGYSTLYAHMSSVTVRCGSSVSQGGTIGIAGTTGNSTGTHLHFEVRYLGGFISPWFVLPAP